MPDYYDMDDIIMEDQHIQVIFQVGANGVGLLDPGSENNSVEKGAKVELPFWLAHELQLRQAVSIYLPACFSQKTRNEIKADAACVNLKVHCPYFYELGCKIVPLRYLEMLSKSHSASVLTAPKFLPRLSKEEMQLFEASRSSMMAFKKWRAGGSRLEKAPVLGRKRKTTIPTFPSSP
ncbi:DNA replication complex GINS protein PSF3-like isoform X2 [Zingiber officinale]|uniref:DNA replication complex GINS protein PSF3-like isoform X2 n=1 Tax=Zingiber officinale TaxID=94328 RepID=UPI001C4BDD07|nr:DNA replication complex GINS protein PSF3-like isoform X2 [Zingiber officinale]